MVELCMVKNMPANARDTRDVEFDPWVGKILWSRKWQPTLAFLPGNLHEQRSLDGYSSQGHKESDTTEVTERRCKIHETCNMKEASKGTYVSVSFYILFWVAK